MTQDRDRGFDRTVAGLGAGVLTLGSLFLSVFSAFLLVRVIAIAVGHASELFAPEAAAGASALGYLWPALGCALGAAILTAVVAALARFALGSATRFRAGRVLTAINVIAAIAVLGFGLFDALAR